MKSVCAIVAVRNEAVYLNTLLTYLCKQGVEVIIIDNGSTDGSIEIAETYIGSPVVRLIHLPYIGCFSLSQQLEAKEKIIYSSNHDWVIHQDADEILQSNLEGENLCALANRLESQYYSVVDFDEFVFLPESSKGYHDQNYLGTATTYYFFQPKKLRLNRMFKRTSFLGFSNSGGHNVDFKAGQIFEGCILRHYICLSLEHACQKYIGRVFSENDRAKGWHKIRLGLSADKLDYTSGFTRLHKLRSPTNCNFSRNLPEISHFWDWNKKAASTL